MTQLFLVAFPLAAVLAEVSFEELSAPAAVQTEDELTRRLPGPAWSWPQNEVDPWTSNHRGCVSYAPPYDGQHGSDGERGLTCDYEKVCCPGGKCVARKRAKCMPMLPYGCTWKVTSPYGKVIYDNHGVCHIVSAGYDPSPTPRPTPPPVHVPSGFRDLGAGKCLTAQGRDPISKYYAGLGDRKCKNKCNSRSDCGGYSVSGYGNCLLWLTTGLVGGGPSWDGASCIQKISGGSSRYVSMGSGKCVGSYGEPIAEKYYAGMGSKQCKKQCDRRSDCGGYSVSSYNNCLLWLSNAVTGGGPAWGGCTCMKKTTKKPSQGWWWCKDGSAKIQSRYLCDGVYDCPDRSDEDPTMCRNRKA